MKNRNASDIMKAAPELWEVAQDAPDLPEKGEGRDHAWLTNDKYLLFQNPVQYWKEHRLTNKVPMVIGESVIITT